MIWQQGNSVLQSFPVIAKNKISFPAGVGVRQGAVFVQNRPFTLTLEMWKFCPLTSQVLFFKTNKVLGTGSEPGFGTHPGLLCVEKCSSLPKWALTLVPAPVEKRYHQANRERDKVVFELD